MGHVYQVETLGLSAQTNKFTDLDPLNLLQSLNHQIVKAYNVQNFTKAPLATFQELHLLVKEYLNQYMQLCQIPLIRGQRFLRLAQGYPIPEPECDYVTLKSLHHYFPYDFMVYKDNRLVLKLCKKESVLTIRLSLSRDGMYDSVLHVRAVPRKVSLKIGTWNVNGAASPEKQLIVDELCHQYKLDIVCLQEIHHHAQSIATPHYHWILGSTAIRRASRGCGFMIRKSVATNFQFEYRQHHPDVLHLIVHPPRMKVLNLINVHLNSADSEGEDICRLGGILSSLDRRQTLVLCGDFNLYLGQDIHTNPEYQRFRTLVGAVLIHPTTNARGDLFLELLLHHKLQVVTTQDHTSTRITWYRGSASSQLDHFIIPIPSNRGYAVKEIRGTWSAYSDHKLLFMTLTLEGSGSHNYIPVYLKNKFIAPTKVWDASRLVGSLPVQRRYEAAARDEWDRMESELNSHGRSYNLLSTTDRWELIAHVARKAARQELRKIAKQPSQALLDAKHNLQVQLQIACRQRAADEIMSYGAKDDYPPLRLTHLIDNLRAARRTVNSLIHERRLENFREMLTAVEHAARPTEKLNLVYNYMKAQRRTEPKTSPVSLKLWTQELEKIAGPSVESLDVPLDSPPLPIFPSAAQARITVDLMRNGTAPGSDLLNIEFFKYCPFMFTKLYDLLHDVYQLNEVPKAFTTTVTQPIPKVPSPKEVTDYRRITLSSEGYKVYIKLLGDLLSDYLPELPEYQSGFRRGRSCDDELHMLNTIITERSNHGLDTYVLSMDYRQAFDMVDIHLLPQILLENGAPPALINRIISACLTEKNCIRWFGELTQPVNKSLGVKQGCPESPRFFNYILNSAIMKVKAIYPALNIGESPAGPPDSDGFYNDLQLPLLLAYADDTVYLFADLNAIRDYLEISIPVFSQFGLHFNYKKCAIMVRHSRPSCQPLPPPLQITLSPTHTVPPQKVSISFSDSIKCLGASLCSSSTRKGIVRPRCHKVMKIYKGMLSHLRGLKLMMPEIIRFYHQAITPALTYGYSSSSFTTTMAQTLHNREIMILRDLLGCCVKDPPNQTFVQLLQGKTINRKLSVYRLRYAGHLSRHRNQSLLIRLSMYRPIARRRVGRPLKTFRQTIREDMQKFRVLPDYPELPTVEEKWIEAFQSREATKKATSALYTQTLEPDDDDPMNPLQHIRALIPDSVPPLNLGTDPAAALL